LPLTHIFNTSISSKTFPGAWKISKIVPVAKSKDPSRLKNYRPISILPALSNALEKIMKDQIVTFCNERGLLNRLQSGFRAGHSTTTALLKITDDISKELDRNLVTILLLLDFFKAFDTVNFKLLCQKLRNFFYFSESAIEFVKSYLTGRPQCVLFVYANDSFSSYLPVTQGVLFFINDISNAILFSNYHIYADDVQFCKNKSKHGKSVFIERRKSHLNFFVAFFGFLDIYLKKTIAICE
jgi:Reverse transcriptase (RNA-dependent DNA polymerase)